MHAFADEGSEAELTDDEAEDSVCKHSMDIMYDRQMSVTIAEYIGRMLRQEADKLARQDSHRHREDSSELQAKQARMARQSSGNSRGNSSSQRSPFEGASKSRAVRFDRDSCS